MIMKKKALAVLFSPKTLYDFIWYYATYGKEYEWDALLYPYGENIKIDSFCRNSGIFNRVFCYETLYRNKNIMKQGVVFITMLMYWILGKSNIYAKRTIEKVIGQMNYDMYVVAPSPILINGCFYILARRNKTVLLEDGDADYVLRHQCFVKDRAKFFFSVKSYLLAKMGYADITLQYWITNFKYCDKYVSCPEKMKNLGYKSINKIRDFSYTDEQLYHVLLKKTFSLSNNILDGDVILFTAPMSTFTTKTDVIWRQTIEYLKKNYNGAKIIVKRHPRDTQEVKEVTGITLIEMDPLIPGELLLENVRVQSYIAMWPSTILMDSHIEKDRIKMLAFSKLINNTDVIYSVKKIEAGAARIGIDKKNIIVI